MVFNSTTTLETLYDTGNSALANMFILAFTAGKTGGGTDGESAPVFTSAEYRITNFSLPEKVVNTYDKWYLGQKLTVPGGLDGDPKTTTFTFRADRSQTLYKMLRKLAENAKHLSATSDYRSDISVTSATISTGATSGTAASWNIKGWFPTNVHGLTFDAGSGEPLLVQVTGAFKECADVDVKKAETT